MRIRNYKLAITLLFAGLLCFGSATRAAVGADAIRLTSTALQEVVDTDAAGNPKVTRVPASKVVPGDEVIYRIEFENTGSAPAEDIVINNPVPANTAYRANSASGPNTDIRFSVDGGRRFAAAENLVVTEADGSTRPASAADYTAIRWQYRKTLQPGEKAAVEYRVVIR